jgi:ribosome-binding protein aMBF1 (putative translation factor)
MRSKSQSGGRRLSGRTPSRTRTRTTSASAAVARRTDDALEIIDRRFFKTARAKKALDDARRSASLARTIHELRTRSGMSQKRLAELVGTTPSVISRLESDDYRGHSLAMLRRIGAALDRRVEVRFVPIRGTRSA